MEDRHKKRHIICMSNFYTFDYKMKQADIIGNLKKKNNNIRLLVFKL